MSEQTDSWRGLCAVLHDLSKKYKMSIVNVEFSAALDIASEEIFKMCRSLDKSEARVADLEAAYPVLGPHDNRSGDEYGPCATCGISPEIVAERVFSARERGNIALSLVDDLEKEKELCSAQDFPGEISPEVDPDPDAGEINHSPKKCRARDLPPGSIYEYGLGTYRVELGGLHRSVFKTPNGGWGVWTTHDPKIPDWMNLFVTVLVTGEQFSPSDAG